MVAETDIEMAPAILVNVCVKYSVAVKKDGYEPLMVPACRRRAVVTNMRDTRWMAPRDVRKGTANTSDKSFLSQCPCSLSQ